jgi:hypothetical protein
VAAADAVAATATDQAVASFSFTAGDLVELARGRVPEWLLFDADAAIDDTPAYDKGVAEGLRAARALGDADVRGLIGALNLLKDAAITAPEKRCYEMAISKTGALLPVAGS